jgi:hypothetical protein
VELGTGLGVDVTEAGNVVELAVGETAAALGLGATVA